MDKLLTSTQVATRLGVSAGRVRQLAIERNLGTIYGRDRFFTEEEVRQMETRKTTPGPFAKLFAPDPAPPATLAELSAAVAGAGIVTDPILTDEQKSWRRSTTAGTSVASSGS